MTDSTPTLRMDIGDKRHWLTVSTGERDVQIDVYEANEVIYGDRDKSGDYAIREWLATWLGVGCDELATGQLLEFQDIISGMVEALEGHRKKKVSTIVSWLSSTLESQEATNNGATYSNETGSKTTNEQPPTEHVSIKVSAPTPFKEFMPTS